MIAAVMVQDHCGLGFPVCRCGAAMPECQDSYVAALRALCEGGAS